MKFVDEVDIEVRSGKGGDGAVSFRRERNIPRGGPDGGDGGRGGSVILQASENVDTLLPLARGQRYAAKNGLPGGGNNRTGRSAPDVVVEVPVGTVVYEEGEQVADLAAAGQRAVVARGGAGGKGNKAFATATHQVPREYTPGGEGGGRTLHLELKLIAEVGLVGLPNAGKSTLLSRLSAARPKVADYPFTTLQPCLGIVSDGRDHELVMADIPGLIEGAAEGAGLGHEFLRHVERCATLLHLVDLQPLDGSDPLANVATINRELSAFSPALAQKPQILVGNKLDLTGAEEMLARLARETRSPIVGISAVTGQGLDALSEKLFWFFTRSSK